VKCAFSIAEASRRAYKARAGLETPVSVAVASATPKLQPKAQVDFHSKNSVSTRHQEHTSYFDPIVNMMRNTLCSLRS